jgi:hypothetical protein
LNNANNNQQQQLVFAVKAKDGRHWPIGRSPAIDQVAPSGCSVECPRKYFADVHEASEIASSSAKKCNLRPTRIRTLGVVSSTKYIPFDKR